MSIFVVKGMAFFPASPVALILSCGLLFAFPARMPGAEKAYRSSLDFGYAFFRFEDGCTMLMGSVSAGDFFDGLQRKEKGFAVQFRKNSSPVTQFPETILLGIYVYIQRDLRLCAALRFPATAPLVPTRLGEVLDAPRFIVKWKTGMKLRSAKTSNAGWRNATVADRAEKKLPLSSLPDGDVWIYELSVQSSDVPLTDSLVVELLTGQGNTLVRLAARL